MYVHNLIVFYLIVRVQIFLQIFELILFRFTKFSQFFIVWLLRFQNNNFRDFYMGPPEYLNILLYIDFVSCLYIPT